MIKNQNYPWYIQHNPQFVSVYDGLFELASNASPLGLGDLFNLDKVYGDALFRLGILWGLQGSEKYYDGLIYGIDNWSETKVWGGQVQSVNQQIYRNFVRLHAYCWGRNFNLQLIQDAFNILLAGYDFTVTVDEDLMKFTINLTARSDILRIVQQIQSYDPHFIGKPVGIAYTINYIPTQA